MAKLCVRELACSRETLVRATMHSHNPRCIRGGGCILLTARLFRSADPPRSWLESTFVPRARYLPRHVRVWPIVLLVARGHLARSGSRQSARTNRTRGPRRDGWRFILARNERDREREKSRNATLNYTLDDSSFPLENREILKLH